MDEIHRLSCPEALWTQTQRWRDQTQNDRDMTHALIHEHRGAAVDEAASREVREGGGGSFNICARVVGRRRAVADDTSNVGSVDDVHLASKTRLPRFSRGP